MSLKAHHAIGQILEERADDNVDFANKLIHNIVTSPCVCVLPYKSTEENFKNLRQSGATNKTKGFSNSLYTLSESVLKLKSLQNNIPIPKADTLPTRR